MCADELYAMQSASMSSTESKSAKVLTGISVGVSVITLMLFTLTLARNDRLEGKLEKQKLTSENLLSERLQAEKVLHKTEKRYEVISARLEAANQDIKHLNHDANVKNEALSLARRDVRASRQRENEFNELLRQKDRLAQQVAYYQLELDKQRTFEGERELEISQLRTDNASLSEKVLYLQMLSIKNILVQTFRKNGDLSLKAKKIKKITADIEVPSVARNVKFTILNPEGKELATNENKSGELSAQKSGKNTEPFYSSHQIDEGFTMEYRPIQMVFNNTENLKPGTYTIIVTNDGLSIGSLQVRLK